MCRGTDSAYRELQVNQAELFPKADRREAAKRAETLLTVTENPADLNCADVILETIVEKSKVKQKHRSLDPFFDRPKLLSNTSTIRITELATALNGTKHLSPENFAGSISSIRFANVRWSN